MNITLDTLELDKINIPPRSILYNLEPIGIGTPYVESLTSYISRLAECHNLNPNRLVCKTFVPYIKTESRINSFLKGSLGPKKEYINGNSPISLEYVSALEELTTRKDLIYLTMNSWSGLLTKNVIGKSRKWCPNCLNEAKNNRTEVYEPLIWYIKDIQLCDKHNVILEDRCPKCERNLNFLHANYIVGHCQYCFTWLGYESHNTIEKNEYQVFLLESFGYLIMNATKLNALPTRLQVGYVLNRLIEDNDFKSPREFANWFGLSYQSIYSWIKNVQRPSIDVFFKIYQKTNLSINDIFGGGLMNEFDLGLEKSLTKQLKRLTLNEIENELKGELLNNNYESLIQLCIAKRFDMSTAKVYFPDLCKEINEKNLKLKEVIKEQKRAEIERDLLIALLMEPSISLYKFSKEFGIPEYEAKYYCPESTKKLITRHRSYVKKAKKIRAENIKNEIKQVVLELHNNGIYPSDKSMRKKLTNPNWLMEPEVRRIWKKELELLGYKK
ncbi:TniQ family protein [Halalkalibacter urbisdiaboli]|uniref:TniQ family protein n=1 Tax=Halalkalibacter urbisdiaboli TaxID=1960589 RepID=UPI000B447543|nr:TniQ family protein [Halalkalibacter urbisdiaboli]